MGTAPCQASLLSPLGIGGWEKRRGFQSGGVTRRAASAPRARGRGAPTLAAPYTTRSRRAAIPAKGDTGRGPGPGMIGGQ